MMDRNFETAFQERRANLTPERKFLGACALLFIASVAGTIYLTSSMSGMLMADGSTQSSVWTQLPGQTLPGAAAAFIGMWMVMMAAMMLPSLTHMLLGYRRSIRRTGQIRLGGVSAMTGAGYFFVWAIFGAVVYPGGVALAAAEMQWMDLARLAPELTGVTLLLAGCFQLTAWKARQLETCLEAPEMSAPANLVSAWRYGLRQGLHCSLSSLGFMAILLTGGVMDVGVMAVLAAAITVERVATRPRPVACAIGVIAIAAGLVVIARTAGLV
jgi:predicted metal-binding membrane protein